MQSVKLSWISLNINLFNDFQTSDTAWAGVGVPLVPLKLDLENKWRSIYVPNQYIWKIADEENYCLGLGIYAKIEGVSLDPDFTILSIDNEQFNVVKVKDVSKVKSLVIGSPILKGRAIDLTLCFDTNKPLPDQKIELYLDKAIQHPDRYKMPVIKFQTQPWRDSYS